MGTITVANKRRGARGYYIGRPSALGNRYVIGRDGDRAEVIARYAAWLDEELTWDGIARAAFDHLLRLAQQGDVTLVCYCAPLACHGDVIKARLEHELTARRKAQPASAG